MLINEVVLRGHWQVTRFTNLNLSNMSFLYVVVIFGKANLINIQHMLNITNNFHQAFGQRINFAKSHITAPDKIFQKSWIISYLWKKFLLEPTMLSNILAPLIFTMQDTPDA